MNGEGGCGGVDAKIKFNLNNVIMIKGHIIFVFNMLILISNAVGQFSIGPKVGAVLATPSYEDSAPLNQSKIEVNKSINYNVGGVLIYQLSDVFAFHTEILYAKKEKTLEGGIQNLFRHNATYEYLEAPVLIAYTFKRKYFTGFVNFGGNLAYWLSGKGQIQSVQYDEVDLLTYEYDVSFGSKPSGDFSGDLFVEDANRVQLGLEIGAGAFINTLSPKNRLLVELKYHYGHSWLARDQVPVGLIEYEEDFRFSYNTLSLSVGYLFGLDFGQGKQGGSSSKLSNRKKKRK
jgi:hypothetical protein